MIQDNTKVEGKEIWKSNQCFCIWGGWNISHEVCPTITRKIDPSKSKSPRTNLALFFEHVEPADVEALEGLGVLGTLAGHDGGVAGLANPQGPMG